MIEKEIRESLSSLHLINEYKSDYFIYFDNIQEKNKEKISAFLFDNLDLILEEVKYAFAKTNCINFEIKELSPTFHRTAKIERFYIQLNENALYFLKDRKVIVSERNTRFIEKVSDNYFEDVSARLSDLMFFNPLFFAQGESNLLNESSYVKLVRQVSYSDLDISYIDNHLSLDYSHGVKMVWLEKNLDSLRQEILETDYIKENGYLIDKEEFDFFCTRKGDFLSGNDCLGEMIFNSNEGLKTIKTKGNWFDFKEKLMSNLEVDFDDHLLNYKIGGISRVRFLKEFQSALFCSYIRDSESHFILEIEEEMNKGCSEFFVIEGKDGNIVYAGLKFENVIFVTGKEEDKVFKVKELSELKHYDCNEMILKSSFSLMLDQENIDLDFELKWDSFSDKKYFYSEIEKMNVIDKSMFIIKNGRSPAKSLSFFLRKVFGKDKGIKHSYSIYKVENFDLLHLNFLDSSEYIREDLESLYIIEGSSVEGVSVSLCGVYSKEKESELLENFSIKLTKEEGLYREIVSESRKLIGITL